MAIVLMIPSFSMFAQNVVGWGFNHLGQATPPAAATNVIAVAAGETHSMVLRSNGTVLSWGSISNVPTDVTNVIAIAAGLNHNLVLRGDGRVRAWGNTADPGLTNLPTSLSNVVAIAAGSLHNVILRSNGTVFASGSNTHGQSTVPTNLTQVVAVAAGPTHSMALRKDGSVVIWGLSSFPVANHSYVPSSLSNKEPVISLVAGTLDNLAVRWNGRLFSWNWNGPTKIPAAATNVVAAAAGTNCYFAVRGDGTIVSWSLGPSGLINVPLAARNVFAVAVGPRHALAVTGDGAPRIFGPTSYRVSDAVGNPLSLKARVNGIEPFSYQWFADGQPMANETNAAVRRIAALGTDNVSYHFVVSNALGSATSAPAKIRILPVNVWGHNSGNQRGIPDLVTNAVAIAAGGFHLLGVRENGAVVAWGKNSDKQVSVPPQATNVVTVAAGGNHSLALRADGSVVAWGRNFDGQTNVPSSATNVIAVAAGSMHSVALKADGTVVAWGHGVYGETNVPATLRDVTAIAAGYHHNLALKKDGTVVAWGNDEEYSVPTTATNLIMISAGWGHSLALRADGAVIAWGDNSYGQIDVPASATNVVQLAAGWAHSFALRADGTVIAWGKGFNGSTNVPADLRNATSIAAGEDFGVALVNVGPPVFRPFATSVSGHVGGRVVLGTAVGGTQPLTLQWFHEGTPIAGATNRFLVLSELDQLSEGSYSLMATNGVGQINSLVINLAVAAVPFIVTTPAIAQIPPWRPFELSVTVQGTGPLGYQWRRNGTNLTNSARFQGVDKPTLQVNTAEFGDAGNYDVVVTNAFGSVTGLVARVAVTPVLVWGDGFAGQLGVPFEATNIVGISAGGDHCLARTAAGRILAWGDNTFSQNIVPFDATNIVAMDDGPRHCLGVRGDGTVVAWGDNSALQCEIPLSATNVISVAAGDFFSLALRSNSTAFSWKSTQHGYSNESNIVAIDADGGAGFLLRSDGRVIPTSGYPSDETNLVAIDSSWNRRLGIRTNGTILDSYYPSEVPAAATNIISVKAGWDHGLALRTDGEVFAWGENYIGQTQIPLHAVKVIAIDAGATHSIALVEVSTNISILRQPVSEAVALDSMVTLNVFASGQGPLHYQWQKDGTNIPGATNATYIISSAQSADAGDYNAWVSNSVESVSSNVATLSVGDDQATPSLSPPLLSGNDFTLRWNTLPDHIYKLQFKAALTIGEWTDVSTNAGTGTVISVTVPVSGAEGYYRVVAEP